MPSKRHVAGAVSALLLGPVLMTFQNCTPGMKANQQFENDLIDEGRKTPENLDSIMGEENKMALKGALGGQQLSCPPSGLPLRWPLGGVAFKDWMTVNYVDRNPAAGVIQDYMGKAHTYDNHAGLDITVPSFRAMDLDFPALAAAAGEVVEIQHSYYDRNRACVQNENNYVKLKHANGFRTVYVHLKRGSVTVVLGQKVVAGQKLGVVGSSGCSSNPHLHFEVRDCNGQVVDPLHANMISNAPVYSPNGPGMAMETLLKQPQMTSVEQMIDPGVFEPNSVLANQIFSLGVTVSSLKANGVVRIDLIKPDGSAYPTPFSVTSAIYRAHSYWYWNFMTGQTGDWTAKFSVNGVPQGERKFSVKP